ncbi:hypothetical protein JHK87_042621 [Glycine soja]|nr:hypothetical protein JHK87_042621 [Glycine soja]
MSKKGTITVHMAIAGGQGAHASGQGNPCRRPRNDKLWSNIDVTGFSVIHKADEFYQDCYHAKEVCGSVVRESNDVGVMESLPIGYTKCNVDASFKQHSNLTRAGMEGNDRTKGLGKEYIGCGESR